jgi:hypothetical protein
MKDNNKKLEDYTAKELYIAMQKKKTKGGGYTCYCSRCGDVMKNCKTPNASICFECSR